MMAGLIRLIKIIRLIEFIRFIKVISLIAVRATRFGLFIVFICPNDDTSASYCFNWAQFFNKLCIFGVLLQAVIIESS